MIRTNRTKILIASAVFGAVIATVTDHRAGAGEYDKCILESAPALQRAANDNALHVIMRSCIKLHEEQVNESEIAKVRIEKLSYGSLNSIGSGLIAQIYNGSMYDITLLEVVLIDKKSKEQRAYQYDDFNRHYHLAPGMFTSGSAKPQFRLFIKSRTLHEYEFPLEFPGVSAQEFFKKYSLGQITVRGLRQ